MKTKLVHLLLVMFLMSQVYARTRHDFLSTLIKVYKTLEEAEDNEYLNQEAEGMDAAVDDSEDTDGDKKQFARQLSSCETAAQCKNAFNKLIKEVYKDLEKNNQDLDKGKKPFKWG